jgi:aspartate/methionine/tyrosine aminotransferase
LDASASWGVTLAEVRKSLAAARADGQTVRALVVINPGNPTGQSLPAETVRELIKLCKVEGMVFMADEVYQENIYGSAPAFYSARKAVMDLGDEAKGAQVVSFHSISKGYAGECGLRGGYFELLGFPQEVMEQVVKLVSITLCSNVPGQFATGLMVNPPRPGSPSYDTFKLERTGILESLGKRSRIVLESLRKLKGVTCNEAEGAMYLFPQVKLPPGAVSAAKAAGKAADTFYCLRLLEETGLVVVPGSGFGQADGTFHFRTTFLPSEADIDSVMGRLSAFHTKFMEKYGATEL